MIAQNVMGDMTKRSEDPPGNANLPIGSFCFSNANLGFDLPRNARRADREIGVPSEFTPRQRPKNAFPRDLLRDLLY
jgi:hypothetical protein